VKKEPLATIQIGNIVKLDQGRSSKEVQADPFLEITVDVYNSQLSEESDFLYLNPHGT
jgi:hypothetical protein